MQTIIIKIINLFTGQAYSRGYSERSVCAPEGCQHRIGFLIILATLLVAVAGSSWFVWYLGCDLSAAVTDGKIALAGGHCRDRRYDERDIV